MDIPVTVSDIFLFIEHKLSEKLSDLWAFPFFTEPKDLLYSWYVLSFILIGIVVYYFQSKTKWKILNFRLLFKFLFPREIYLHESAKIDYRYYIINRFIFQKLYRVLVSGFGPIFIGISIASFLTFLFGTSSRSGCDSCILVYVLYSASYVLVEDFAFFISHYIHHKSKILWEFHKVHHSAEVLTPITKYRFHPVEQIIESFFEIMLEGIVVGLFAYFVFGEMTEANYFHIGILNVSITVFVFNGLANLRHSHIWLSYGTALNHVFISPAQHQIHHSCENRHIDKNFGLLFALWDWAFSTLYVPRKQESFRIGLTVRDQDNYNGVLQMYILPFVRLADRLFPRNRSVDDLITPLSD